MMTIEFKATVQYRRGYPHYDTMTEEGAQVILQEDDNGVVTIYEVTSKSGERIS